LAGDWDGDGIDTIGAVDPRTATYYLLSAHANSAPPAHIFHFGGTAFVPVMGDWDGDGDDTVGAYDPTSGRIFLRNVNDNAGPPDAGILQVRARGGLPRSGHWPSDSNGSALEPPGITLASVDEVFRLDFAAAGRLG
jgi:hypothetical protein